MALSKYKLGELIEPIDRKNTNLIYGIADVRGVSNTKEIMLTKANIKDRILSTFYVVKPNEFVFNRRTTRNGERLGLGFNNTGRAFIFTEDYVAFTVSKNNKNILLPEYLYIYFLRDEFDRYVRYNSWGSATEFFNWDDMCDIEINLPTLTIQQKYVNIYNALLQNQKVYERGLDDLNLIFDAYIEKLRRELPRIAIGEHIEESDVRNVNDMELERVKGVSIERKFINTKADMEGVNTDSYKTVAPKQFAFVSVTSRNGEKLSIAFNDTNESFLVSSTYIVFAIRDKSALLPEYLNINLNRSEFNRYARFHSWGSAREVFTFDDMRQVKIPVPSTEVQQGIVNIFNAYSIRKDIVEKLKAQIKDICPILIKGAMEEGK
jgi:type I restriction enzyme S subunit